jgi:hypothetical protein
VTTTMTAAPTPSQRCSRIEAGTGIDTTDMDVDIDTDDSNKAKAEVEMDCLTSHAPSWAASPPLQQRHLIVHSGVLKVVGLGLKVEVPLVGRAGSCCSQWAIRSLHGPVEWAGSSSG